MKNMKKLVALFAATVMTLSLSVSAFAAVTVNNDGNDTIADGVFNLVFTGSNDADQMTMIAYLVEGTTWAPYDGSQEVVAIDQVGGSGAGFGTVPVDVAKLTAADAADGDEDVDHAIAVTIGGTDVDAEHLTKALITYSAEDNAIYVTFMNGAETVDSVATVGGKAVLTTTTPTLTSPSEDYVATGYAFVGWVTADGDDVTNATDITENTTVYAKYKAQITTEDDTVVDLLYGDVNCDGEIDGTDTNYISRYDKKGLTKNNNVTKIISHLKEIVCGDVNDDDEVDGTDTNYVSRYDKKGLTKNNNVSKNIYVINVAE